MNERLLEWARTEAGYPLDEAARLLGVTAEKLESWEAGDDLPTLAQLRKVADRYGRTVAFFFLADRPESDVPALPDFRDLSEDTLSPRLRREMRKVERRRQVLLDLEQPPTWKLADLDVGLDSPALAADGVRQMLGVTLAEQLAQPDAPTALRWWIDLLEAAGAVVFQMSRIPSEECRGFSVYHDELPIIVVNGGETEAARIFTLLHELAHLLLRNGGVCIVWSDQQVEQRCNAFAAEMLMPTDMVMNLAGSGDVDTDVERLANRFNVSLFAAAVRLKDFGFIGQNDLDRIGEEAATRTERRKQQQRETPGGPPHYRTHLRNLGESYVSTVLDAYRADVIDFADAATFLEAKLGTVERMEAELDRRSVAG